MVADGVTFFPDIIATQAQSKKLINQHLVPKTKKMSFDIFLLRFSLWELTDSNRRPSACKADALNQLS